MMSMRISISRIWRNRDAGQKGIGRADLEDFRATALTLHVDTHRRISKNSTGNKRFGLRRQKPLTLELVPPPMDLLPGQVITLGNLCHCRPANPNGPHYRKLLIVTPPPALSGLMPLGF